MNYIQFEILLSPLYTIRGESANLYPYKYEQNLITHKERWRSTI